VNCTVPRPPLAVLAAVAVTAVLSLYAVQSSTRKFWLNRPISTNPKYPQHLGPWMTAGRPGSPVLTGAPALLVIL